MTSPQNTVLDEESHPVDADHLEDDTTAAERRLSRGALVRRRFLRKKSGLFGSVVLLLIALLALIGPYLTHYTYSQIDYSNVFQGPHGDHILGGNQIGQDNFAQMVHGLRKSLVISLIAGVLTTAIAAVAGSVAGYFGGASDITITWIIDLLLSLPSFLILAILSTSLSGHSWLLLVPLLSIFGWMITGRVVRSMTRGLKEREYVNAARFMGVPAFKIIRSHILPNMASLLIVDVTINVAAVTLAESGLSFFGFGVQPPDVSLGTIIGDTYQNAYTYPYTFWPAAGALILLVLSVSVIGDALRDAIDPTSGSSRV